MCGNGISSKACRDRQHSIGFSRIGEIFPKMTHTFPMIKSKGLKLQTTNISSGLSTRLFVFRMPSNFKVYLTKAGHYRQFDCSFWRQNIIRFLKTAPRKMFVSLFFFNVQDPTEKHPATFFYLFLFVCLFSFLQCGLNTFGNHVFDHMKSKRKRTYLFQVSAGHFGLRENSVGVLIFVLACSLPYQSIFLTF